MKINVILDVYRAHRIDHVKYITKSLSVHLCSPTECTSTTFSKANYWSRESKGKALFRKCYQGLTAPRVTSMDAIQKVIAVWESIRRNIKSACASTLLRASARLIL